METYDLHVHSTNSDGRETPRAVIEQAADRVAGFVFVDHSGITFDDDLKSVAKEAGTELLFPGVEVSTITEGRKYHVLVYGRRLQQARDFTEFIFHPTKVKNDAYERVLERLRDGGHRLPSFEDMLAGKDLTGTQRYPSTWMMSKSRIRGYLADLGTSEETRAAVSDYYDQTKATGPDRYLDTTEVVRAAREIGCLPVLAHPWWEIPVGRNTADQLSQDVTGLVANGLLALETSSRHTNIGSLEDRREFAHAHGVAESRGSDYHANGKTSIGENALSEQLLSQLVDTAQSNGVSLW